MIIGAGDAGENILRELKEKNYQFIGFDQAEQFRARNEPFVILRHDIDLDISAALPMATGNLLSHIVGY